MFITLKVDLWYPQITKLFHFSRPDKKSCKAEGEPMSLIFTSDNQIRMLSEEDNTLSLLHSDNTSKISGLDVSISAGVIYFSIEDSGIIMKLHMKNNSKYYITSVGRPRILALDWISQNIYFVNSDTKSKSITICNFDMGKCANIKELYSNSHISALAVDAINKYVFYVKANRWAFNSPNYVIYRCNLDGTNEHELVNASTGHISGLAFDSNKRILYFVEQYQGDIFMVKYDGTIPSNIISNLTRPRGLNLFENNLYFFTHNGYMGKCNLYGEKIMCEKFKIQTYANQLFVISQQSRQAQSVNICSKHSCSYLCIPSEVEVRCLCPNGHIVEEGKPCKNASVCYFLMFIASLQSMFYAGIKRCGR